MTLSNNPSVSDDKRSVSAETRAMGDSSDTAAMISLQARVTVTRRKSASPMMLCNGVLKSCAWIVKRNRTQKRGENTSDDCTKTSRTTDCAALHVSLMLCSTTLHSIHAASDSYHVAYDTTELLSLSHCHRNFVLCRE